ncbi:MAG: alpha-amylase family glycosyl hydrolase, partial [Fervidobacterium sp.]
MKELKELKDYLKNQITGKTLYAIPKHWFPLDYSGKFSKKDGHYFVDPYEYYAFIVEKILESAQEKNYSQSLAILNNETNSSWLKRAKIYGALPRTTVAYNHKGFGSFEPEDILGFKETGTFLKMIGILPYLRKMGVNVLYMLPISKMSQIFKKGEIGSPYSVKNPIELDESYHDPLLPDLSVSDEFKALVQAAHILGIRIVLDFIPR